MKRFLFFAIAACYHFVAISQAGTKSDVVVKTNGDQLTGNVVEITDSEIRFKYPGEQVIYAFKKADIRKITFASGRTETYNKTTPTNSDATISVKDTAAATSSEAAVPAAERRNKIAILPFSFLRDGKTLPQDIGDQVQDECYTILSQHSGAYTVVNPRTTNVKLAKAGIDKSTMIKYTMAEICEVLGVEFVVDGVISQNRTSQSVTGNKSYDFKSKDDKKSNNDRVSGSSSSSTNISDDYESVTNINMYNDKNENIYNVRRKALFSTVGAYKNTLGYLLKRSPIYNK